MATTTATFTLTSADLLSSALSISSSMTLYKDGTTSTGLDQMNYHRAIIPTGTNFDLIAESAALTEDASYVYIINKNTTKEDYVIISIVGEVLGRLYAGDWLFMPWDCDLSAADTDSSIEIQAFNNAVTVEYALFHNGETLPTAAD
tara:strand:- start:1329 stop:1766 length:438 start_codon:yes stop_codon:yes gene_type:complete